MKTFSLSISTSAFEHKTTLNSAKRVSYVSAANTIERVRANVGSQFPLIAEVRPPQASVVVFRSVGKGLCLVVLWSSQLVYIIFLLWQSFHLKVNVVQHQGYFSWVGGMATFWLVYVQLWSYQWISEVETKPNEEKVKIFYSLHGPLRWRLLLLLSLLLCFSFWSTKR